MRAGNIWEIEQSHWATHDMPGLFAYAQSPARTVLVARKNAVSDRRSFILSGLGLNEYGLSISKKKMFSK